MTPHYPSYLISFVGRFSSVNVKAILRAHRRAIAAVFVVTSALVSGCIGTTALAATYYVSTDGSDRNNGSEAEPWRSLQRAANRVRAGDVVLVHDGRYKPFHIGTSGKRDKRIEFRTLGKDAVITGIGNFDGRAVAVSILANYITFEGFTVRVNPVPASSRSRGIRVSGVHGRHVQGVHVRRNNVTNAGWVGITTSYADDTVIEHNEVSGSYREHGIYVANSGDRPVIRGNVVHDNGEAGIQINADPQLPGDGIVSGALVEGNTVYRNGKRGSAALNFASVRDSRVVNNLVYGNYSQGIANWDDEAGEKFGCKNNVYIHNTVVMPAGARHALVFRNGSTGNTVQNNVLIHLGDRDGLAADASSLPGLVSDYNILSRVEDADRGLIPLTDWRRKRNLDLHSRAAAPAEIFADIEKDDYRPALRGPAVDHAQTDATVTQDLLGTRRPQGPASDIGAYELVSPDASETH